MPEIVASYDYTDEQGRLLYQNVRFEPKDFRPRRPDGSGGWAWNLDGTRHVLYRLPELLAATLQDWALIVEGEKDVENLRALGFVATTSGNASSWREEFAAHFAGRLVCILPDKDKAGRRYAATIVDSLCGVAAEVRLAEVPGDHKDISEYIEARDAADEQTLRIEIQGMIDAAKRVEAGSESKKDPAGIIVPRPVYVRLQDVQAKPVHWFWQDRIPFAMLCLLVGIEGLGKTFLALYMAACATIGRLWPDSENRDDAPAPGNVILLTSEDHLEYTIRPRFDALGGDPARLFALKGVRSETGDEFFDVMQHLPALETMIEDVGDVRLVLVDPLTAFLGSTDQHKNGEVRVALARFNALAEKHGCAVLGISHLSKDTTKQAIHRTLGSVAFSAAARAVWLVAQDKDDDRRRLFVPIKMNIGQPAKSLAFRIEDMRVSWDDGQFEYDADEVLAANPHEDAKALTDACEWLQGLLADGRVVSKEIRKLARQEQISGSTLKRAKAKLRVQAIHDGMGTGSFWYWRLPREQPR
jgi:5S rRNA maturation endonuclease (ribonuclease M5)